MSARSPCATACWGEEISSDGHNLFGRNTGCGPLAEGDQVVSRKSVFLSVLGPLGGNGGRTPTHPLLEGSPAVDAGAAAGCEDGGGVLLTTDRRDLIRHADGDGDGAAVCDVGAYEAD